MENAGFSGREGVANQEITRRKSTVVDNHGGNIGSGESVDQVISEDNVKMKKLVGLPSGVSFILGTMIGSGIFISPKGVLVGTGSVGGSLLVWVGCGVISLGGALCLVELGTMIPMSGGEFIYLRESLGPIPAFICVWSSFLIIMTSSQAVIALSFAQYILTPFFDACGPPGLEVKILAAATILTVTAVNCYSAQAAARVQVLFTVVKTLSLVVIIVGGIVSLAQGNLENISTGFEGTNTNPNSISLAFYSGFWAYGGSNSLNFLIEELKNPEVNLPRSIGIALPLVTVIYLLTNISYLTVLSKAELLASPAVAVAWGERILGSISIAIPIAVAFSTYGALNGFNFISGRLCYVAGREGHFPKVLSYVNVHHYTPWPALMFLGIIAMAMIVPGNIGSLINFVSFTGWLIHGATFFGLILMRFTRKDWKRPYKVPIIIPVLMVAVSVFLIVAPIYRNPQIELLYAVLLVFGGLIFYVPFVYFKLKLGFLDSFYMWIQLFLQVAPSRYEPDS